MDAKKCDICGKFYERYPKHPTPNRWEILNSIVIYNDEFGINSGDKFDICYECMADLIRFLEDRGYAKPMSDLNRTQNYIIDNYVAKKEG